MRYFRRYSVGGRWTWVGEGRGAAGYQNGWSWVPTTESEIGEGPTSPPPAAPPGGRPGVPIPSRPQYPPTRVKKPPKKKPPKRKPPKRPPVEVPPPTLYPPTDLPPVYEPPVIGPPFEPPLVEPPVYEPPIGPPYEPPIYEPPIGPPYEPPPIVGPPMGPPYEPPVWPPYGPPGCPPTVPICDQSERRYYLSFTALAVAGGAQATIVARPQYIFRPDQFIVPNVLAPFFDIDSIDIGVAPQLAAVGITSAVIFSEVSVNNQVVFDTAQPGIDITLRVTNSDVVAHNFQATLIGLTVN